jgi:hypothetical protein
MVENLYIRNCRDLNSDFSGDTIIRILLIYLLKNKSMKIIKCRICGKIFKMPNNATECTGRDWSCCSECNEEAEKNN